MVTEQIARLEAKLRGYEWHDYIGNRPDYGAFLLYHGDGKSSWAVDPDTAYGAFEWLRLLRANALNPAMYPYLRAVSDGWKVVLEHVETPAKPDPIEAVAAAVEALAAPQEGRDA